MKLFPIICSLFLLTTMCFSAGLPDWYLNPPQDQARVYAQGAGSSTSEAILDGLLNLEQACDQKTFRAVDGKAIGVRSFGQINVSVMVKTVTQPTAAGKNMRFSDTVVKAELETGTSFYRLQRATNVVSDGFQAVDQHKEFTVSENNLILADFIAALRDAGLEIRIFWQEEEVYVLLGLERESLH